MQPEKAGEEEYLTKTFRVKVASGFPNCLSILRANLALVPASYKTDWSFNDSRTLTLSCIINSAPFRNIDVCHEFVGKFQEYFVETLAGGKQFPSLPFCNEAVPVILQKNNAHCVYFFNFDIIGHCFVLDTCQGRGKVYQSFVNAGTKLGVIGYENIAIKDGFTAG